MKNLVYGMVVLHKFTNLNFRDADKFNVEYFNFGLSVQLSTMII